MLEITGDSVHALLVRSQVLPNELLNSYYLVGGETRRGMEASSKSPPPRRISKENMAGGRQILDIIH